MLDYIPLIAAILTFLIGVINLVYQIVANKHKIRLELLKEEKKSNIEEVKYLLIKILDKICELLEIANDVSRCKELRNKLVELYSLNNNILLISTDDAFINKYNRYIQKILGSFQFILAYNEYSVVIRETNSNINVVITHMLNFIEYLHTNYSFIVNDLDEKRNEIRTLIYAVKELSDTSAKTVDRIYEIFTEYISKAQVYYQESRNHIYKYQQCLLISAQEYLNLCKETYKFEVLGNKEIDINAKYENRLKDRIKMIIEEESETYIKEALRDKNREIQDAKEKFKNEKQELENDHNKKLRDGRCSKSKEDYEQEFTEKLQKLEKEYNAKLIEINKSVIDKDEYKKEREEALRKDYGIDI